MYTSKTLNTPLAAVVKVAAVALLTAINVELANGCTTAQLFTLDKLDQYGVAILLSTIPVAINWLNKADQRYGLK